MDRQRRDSAEEVAIAPAAADGPRIKAVACLGGLSFERGIRADELHEHLQEAENVVWVDVQDPGPDELATLVDELGFHPLALEDLALGEGRPRIDEFKGYVRLVTHAAIPGGGRGAPRTAEVDLFLGRSFVVAVHRGPVPALDEALNRWTRGGPMLAEGVGFLAYAALDAIVDSYAAPIARVEDEIDATEAAVLARSDDSPVLDLIRLKRDLAALRRVLHPLQAVFQVLLRRDHPFFPGHAEILVRDVYEHLLRILDSLDAGREMAAGTLDASLAISSNRLNRTMKRLAVITVAMAVVGSVFGAYGMNFSQLPLAAAPWGFPAVVLGTTGLVAVAVAFGWGRGWW